MRPRTAILLLSIFAMFSLVGVTYAAAPLADDATQRAIRDLAAQESMAQSAYLTAVLTVGSLVVSAVALGCLVYSLSQTRRAMADTRELGQAQVRAFLSLDPEMSVAFMDDGTLKSWDLTATITANNGGNSRATRIRMDIRLSIVSKLPNQPEQKRVLVMLPSKGQPAWNVVDSMSGKTMSFAAAVKGDPRTELPTFERFYFEAEVVVNYETVFGKAPSVRETYVSAPSVFKDGDNIVPAFKLLAKD